MRSASCILVAVILVIGVACHREPPPPPGRDGGPGPPCEADSDCDDGLVCNGLELCGTVSGRCVAGIPLECDDGIRCTVDRCVEPAGICTSQPDDALCPLGESCRGIDGTGCIVSCPSGAACDPLARCGCVAEEACTYSEGGRPECALPGSLTHGLSCTTRTGCVAGAQCVLRDSSGTSAYAECRTFCGADRDCPSGTRCRVAVTGTSVLTCTRSCNLVTQIGCDAPARCDAVRSSDGTYYADCIVRGGASEREPCGSGVGGCAAGLRCVTQPSGGALCDTICLSDRDCASGLRCVRLLDPFIVDGREYSVCN